MNRYIYSGNPFMNGRTAVSGEGGYMFKGITGLAMFVAAIAAMLGLVSGGIEILNPSISGAKAYRMNEETAALASKNAYEQAVRQIELDKQRALAQKELEWYDRKMSLLEDVVFLLAFALAGGILAVGFGASIYIGCLGIRLLQRQRTPSQAVQPTSAKIFHLPRQPEQARQGSGALSPSRT